jgi:hypothetical protein
MKCSNLFELKPYRSLTIKLKIMKKIILAFFLIASFGICEAQVTVPKTTPSTKDFIKPPAIGDVDKTTSSVVDDLTSKLSLPAAQKPKLIDAIGGFLKQKKTLLDWQIPTRQITSLNLTHCKKDFLEN